MGPIRVASYDFVQNQVLAAVYAYALRRQGYPVQVVQGVGTREIVFPALEQGSVDVVVDYTGTALQFLQRTDRTRAGSGAEIHATLRRALARNHTTALAAAPGEDQNAFVVSTATARRDRLTSISDLRPISTGLRFGAPPECATRWYCLKGLEGLYGLRFRSFTPMPSREVTVAALNAGEIDVGLLESTDPVLIGNGLRMLADDRHLQPPDNVVPLVSDRVLSRYGPQFAHTLNWVSARLTTTQLINLNRAVELNREAPRDAAAKWIDAQPG